MIESNPSNELEVISAPGKSQRLWREKSGPYWRWLLSIHRMTWVCLCLASLCASWFTYQSFLIPQPDSFAPDWGNAHWIRPAGGVAPVAYFRYSTGLDELPDSAFVTIAASQIFKLYVNGNYIGSNKTDFTQGIFPRAYIFDVSSALQTGANVIAVRVANADEQLPALKASLGMVRGHSIYYLASGSSWQATFQSTAVYPRYAARVTSWTTIDFDASSWTAAQTLTADPFSPALTVNPHLYEQPGAQSWISASLGHEAYFVRQISLPLGVTGAWLRLAATGIADIYINGQQYITWNGQSTLPDQTLADYLSENTTAVEYRSGLMMGMYNIGTYLHAGTNTLAIHVLAPGLSAAQVGLGNLSAALSVDMLFRDWFNRDYWVTTHDGWHAADAPVSGWEQGNTPALSWPSPVPVGRPGAVRSLYLPDNVTARDQQMVPVPLSLLAILLSVGAVLALWWLMARSVRRYYRTRIDALEVMGLAYLPAVALLALLVALSREPQIPQPFPYTGSWGVVLLAIVAASYLFLWRHARTAKQQNAAARAIKKGMTFSMRVVTLRNGLLKLPQPSSATGAANGHVSSRRAQVQNWLRTHWPLLLLMLVAIPMISYNLSYEPYWQDELASFYASRGVLAHGLPFFPSGFLYTKSELFSYLLALWTTLLGQGQGIPRMISMLEYLVSLPLLYTVGCKFFDKRIALLATAMLAFSPISLVWGRQMRMYEQAQLLTLLTVFLFYLAVKEQRKVRLLYLAAFCLVADYLSHEEVFIILPALLLCILLLSRDAHHRFPAVLYQKHWWIAGALCVGIIGAQLLAAQLTHPMVLGTDSSQRPLVQFTTDNVPFYVELLFFPQALGHGTYPFITINSLLALVGCVLARSRKEKGAIYCALFLVGSLLTLVFAFTMEADRYIYPLLPFYYLMGAYAMLVMLRTFWSFARPRIVLQKAEAHSRPVFGGYVSGPFRVLVTCTVSLVTISVLILPILPLSGYNLFISRLVGFSYHRHYADYDAVGQYMRQYMQPGDIVIAVSPAVSVLYYVGHVDYYFSIDRALFVIQKDGRPIETASGAQALFNQNDFQAVLSKYKRVWIISDNGVYQAQAIQHFTFPPDFHIVFEGYGSAVYFRGS